MSDAGTSSRSSSTSSSGAESGASSSLSDNNVMEERSNGDARVNNASSSSSSNLKGKREWRRCRYSNGTTYDGYVRDGKRDGHGVYIDKAGNRYEGEWSNDRAHGYGTKVFSSKGDRHGDIMKLIRGQGGEYTCGGAATSTSVRGGGA